MFKTPIRTSPLFDDTSNNFFENIQGDRFNGDVSFISTLRALVAPRMESSDTLYLRFNSSRHSAHDISGTPTGVAVRGICDYFDPNDSGSIYIHSFNHHAQDSNYACLELMKGSFCKTYPGWIRLEKVTEFYQRQFLTMCFINPERKSVAIFVDNMDMRKMHYLQCSIFAFLPWYFDPAKGVSEIEMELINSLREKTHEKYEDVIARIASGYDFRSAKIRKLLSGFETRYEKYERLDVANRIQNILQRITALNEEIGFHLREKNELDIKLLGLDNKISNTSEDSEIMEYFLCNDRLVLISVSDDNMLFGVKTYIEYFDEDMASSAISNKHSYLYHPDGEEGTIPEASVEKLMKAIFIDQILKIRVCAAYEFNLNGSVSPRGAFNFGHEFRDCMPNPHIDGYRCLGNYQLTINELLSVRNYIAALEQCVASAKSLNFGDSVVMDLFSRAIHQVSCTYNNKCIELPDGQLVDPTGAIKWLETQGGLQR